MTTAGEEAPSASDIDAIRSRIVAILASVLDGIEVHDDSNLLDLGATSLTAVRIRSRIRAELDKEIPLIDLLEYPTPRELAPVVAAAERWTGDEEWQQLDWASEEAADDEGSA